MKNIKTSFDAKSSMLHNSALLCNALLNCGTGNDIFMRDNLDWVGKSSYYARFTAVSTLGLIHMGNHSAGMDILKP